MALGSVSQGCDKFGLFPAGTREIHPGFDKGEGVGESSGVCGTDTHGRSKLHESLSRETPGNSMPTTASTRTTPVGGLSHQTGASRTRIPNARGHDALPSMMQEASSKAKTTDLEAERKETIHQPTRWTARFSTVKDPSTFNRPGPPHVGGPDMMDPRGAGPGVCLRAAAAPERPRGLPPPWGLLLGRGPALDVTDPGSPILADRQLDAAEIRRLLDRLSSHMRAGDSAGPQRRHAPFGGGCPLVARCEP